MQCFLPLADCLFRIGEKRSLSLFKESIAEIVIGLLLQDQIIVLQGLGIGMYGLFKPILFIGTVAEIVLQGGIIGIRLKCLFKYPGSGGKVPFCICFVSTRSM